MNLDQVASYLAVIRTGSFHAAARDRGLSQASVSQHVRALEEQQRTTLIVRDRAGCRPVPGTEEFAHYAGLLIDLAERTSHVLSRRRLMVGTASNIGTYLIQPAFRSFTETNDAELVIAPNGQIADRLEAGGLDVALMEWWDDRPGFQAVRWAEEELLVIVSPAHPWRDRDTVHTAELAVEPLLGGEPQTGTGTLLREHLDTPLRVSMNLGSTEAVKRAVRNGLGISLVLAGAIQDELATGKLHALRLTPPLHKPLWVILRQDLPTTSPAWSLIDLLTPPKQPA
ncbi:LysR family transcriptional regulator [Spirillospora sp. NPDC048911]|uniref:LysR family transcriptional regulator n=1 Tax=Spirillospora sp. NPDC048911 TaxID=3364527 RepID=UPI0037153FC3